MAVSLFVGLQAARVYTHHRHLLLLLSQKPDTHFTVPRKVEGWVDLVGWLHTEILPAHRRWPILVLTGSDKAQLRWSRPTRYHQAKPYVCMSYSFWDTQRQRMAWLWNWGYRGRSRSLKMAPFDRSYTTFYRLAIVSIALCCTIFDDLEWPLSQISRSREISTLNMWITVQDRQIFRPAIHNW